MDRREIGRRLRLLREDAGYSLHAARDVCGLSVPTIRAIEAGSELVKQASVTRYAHAFGLTVIERLEGEQCN